ncbi:MAG: Fic family protein [Nitrososphaerota archaeon]|nr:Fic family protein [Nitrososphaerota archaeon]MDG6992788.1 Fic family protein [Nitrososphaerota archaeon]
MVYPSYNAVLDTHKRIIRRTGGELGMVSSSNLACIFDTIRDIGEHLSDKDAARRKSGYLLYNVISMHPFLDGNKRTA